jgi:FkbM family methyltransferase
MPHLAHPLNKLRNGLYVSGWREAIVGFMHLAMIKLIRPEQVEITLRDGLTLRFNYPNQMPTVLVCFGDYIDPEYDYLLPHVGPKDLIVDVGAGIGQFALPMAKRGALVDAWEPVGANFNMLLANIAANDVITHTHPRAIAMGEDNKGITIVGSGLLSHVEKGKGKPLPSTTIDIEYPDQRIKILKVDTAGSEEKVLFGATRLLQERRAQYLVILLSNPVIDILPDIASFGYQFFFWSPKTRQRQNLADLSRTSILDRQIWPARQIMAEAL